MDPINLEYVNEIKEFLNIYIQKEILECVYVRGSLARNELDNRISDLDFIIFFKDKRSMTGFVNRFNSMINEKFLITMPLDIIYIDIHNPISYNIIYVLKYKSKLWLGTDDIDKFVNEKNVNISDFPYTNVRKITGLLDPVIDAEILKATCNIDLTGIQRSTRHTIGLVKRIIRSIYEYLYLNKELNFISFSCKEICEEILKREYIDNKWKNLLKQSSDIIEKCKNDFFYTENNLESVVQYYKEASSLFKEEKIRNDVEQILDNNTYIKQIYQLNL